MNGLHALKTVWRTAMIHFAQQRMMSVAMGSACLLIMSGCAISKNMLNGPTPAPAAVAAAAADPCAKPDCAAPAATAMTAMPVPQASPAPAAVPGAQLPIAGQQTANAAYGTSATNATLMPVPPVPMGNMAAIPPGWKLIPDVPPPVPPEGFMTEERLREQAEGLGGPASRTPVVWPVDEKLLRCERQVADMTEKLEGLQTVTEVTKQAMLSMELEQIRLRNENEALRRQANESHREVIKSIDSLSEYMDEMAPAEPPVEARPQRPTPARSVRSAAKPVEQTSVLPPVDEEL